jgi:hypothetical protein
MSNSFPKVAIGSAFRNSASWQVERYFTQVYRYEKELIKHGWGCRVIAVEGDSITDETRQSIEKWADIYCIELNLVQANHGGPEFGSVESLERFAALSKVGNAILERVEVDDDIVVYVESDLLWRPDTLLRLGSQVLEKDLDVVSPLVFAGQHFYDVWGFRGLDNARFAPFHPYHSMLNLDGLTEVSSVGSCLVMRAQVANDCRIIDNECLVGFCKDARNKGYKIWVDARERINHP